MKQNTKPAEGPKKRRWTELELMKTLVLYLESNPGKNFRLSIISDKIEALAKEIGRETGAITMRLMNFKYRDVGEGLPNGGDLCNTVWDKYNGSLDLLKQDIARLEGKETYTPQDSDILITNKEAMNITIGVSIAMQENRMDISELLLRLNNLIGAEYWKATEVAELSKEFKSMQPELIEHIIENSKEHLNTAKFAKLNEIINILK